MSKFTQTIRIFSINVNKMTKKEIVVQKQNDDK